jgi:hypothetical protein
MKHAFKRNWQSCIVAKYDLGEGVAHEHHVESGFVCKFCGGKVVGGNKRDSV